MKVLWRQFFLIMFCGVCLVGAFIYGTYWGVKIHSPKITDKDWLELESAFAVKCEESKLPVNIKK
jgi:hypothetical protein